MGVAAEQVGCLIACSLSKLAVHSFAYRVHALLAAGEGWWAVGVEMVPLARQTQLQEFAYIVAALGRRESAGGGQNSPADHSVERQEDAGELRALVLAWQLTAVGEQVQAYDGPVI